MSKPPSLQDVARAANLSPATVSRYLNGSLSLPLETSTRIDAAIAELGYRPNPHARSLSRGRSDTIGLVIPDIANPFFSRLAAAIEKYADEAGLGLMLCSSLNRPKRELDYIEQLRRNHVDGLLFATNHQDHGALAAAINAVPNIVLIDEDISGTHVPKVFSDNSLGGRLAARHLIDMGHRNLAYIGGPIDIMSAKERLAGFRDVAVARDARISAAFHGDYTSAHGRDAMIALLDRRTEITAVFAGSDEILLGMLDVMRERGIKAGQDLSLITFDDAGQLGFFDPPITAIRQSTDEIGRQSFEFLRARIAGETGNPVIRVSVELIVRQSIRCLTDQKAL
jgi:LacI family transcriptional regulator